MKSKKTIGTKGMELRIMHRVSRLVIVVFGMFCSFIAAEASEFRLSVSMSNDGKTTELKSWNLGELKGLKQITSRENDPETKKPAKFKGAAFSSLLEAAMAGLTAEQKAQIDLVILSDIEGNRAQLPRAFVVKYPIIVALERDGKPLPGTAPLMTVVPWTSNPKALKEGLPLETYFMNRLKNIELANYRDRFGSLFLKRRTDPTAMRGEKVFVQNCARCHAGGKALQIRELMSEERRRSLASKAHPDVKGAPKLTDRDWRALKNYFDAYQVENATPVQVSSHR